MTSKRELASDEAHRQLYELLADAAAEQPVRETPKPKQTTTTRKEAA